MFHSVLNMPLELLTIFATGSILMFDWVLDMPLTCLKNVLVPILKPLTENEYTVHD